MNVRKTFNGSQNGDSEAGGYQRCWGEWNDHPQGSSTPSETLQIGYNSTNQLFENMVMTWDTLGDTADAEGIAVAMTTNTPGGANDIGGTRFLGSILYARAGSTFTPSKTFQSANTTGLTVTDLVMYLAPEFTTKWPAYLYPCTTPTCSNNVCNNCLAVHAGTPLVNAADSGWTLPNLKQGNGLAAATGGTSAFTLLPGICKRYINGTLTGTPLWPWSMDARISAARVAGSYRDLTVTTEIESILGAIPAECRSDVEPSEPQPNITGGPVQPGKETGRYGGFDKQPERQFGHPTP